MQCFDCETKQAFGKWSLKRGNRLREVVAQRGSTVYIYILNSIIYFTVDSDWLLNYVFFPSAEVPALQRIHWPFVP